MPIFANPWGLLALMGVPVILAIHFLQQRARVARTSTWFLIEKLSPDSARGRTWDRLRSSRQLWLQLLAVLLASWVLAEPRWVRAESAQTVAIVLDASASMEAFRTPAIAAVEREMTLARGLAARTTWLVMTTNPRQPPLYRGEEELAALAALARWQPDLGQHDAAPALQLARGLVGAAGRSLLITDQRATVPSDQRAAGVGRPIDNVGFAGAFISRDEQGGHTWRALVKNHSTKPLQRTWHLESGGTASAGQAIELAPGALVEISARLPDGTNDAVVVLAADDFASDDRLPVVRPQPKPLTVAVTGDDAPAEFFRRLAAAVDGVSLAAGGRPATLKVGQLAAEALAGETAGGIFWPPPDRRAQVPLAAEPVTPERHALVDALNWQGWLGTGAYGYTARPDDTTLLWQGRFPLVLLRTKLPAPVASAADEPLRTRQLLLAFDWGTSNAARLPATVLLARRFLETERDAQRAPYTANFDSNAPLAPGYLPRDGDLTLAFTPVNGGVPESRIIPVAERSELRAPGRSGVFTLMRGEELVLRGSAQFSDTREGDFRRAEQFFIELRGEREAAIQRNTRGDPFTSLWLALIAALALGSWWTRGAPGESTASSAARTFAGKTAAFSVTP